MTKADHQTRLARAMLAFRRERRTELPAGLFAELGWDFLLELFVADADGERLTGQMVVVRSAASPMTASRWLKYLSQEGLVVGDGDGDLEDLLTLSPQALEKLENLMMHAAALFEQLSTISG